MAPANLEKYNKEEKLDREEKMKNESTSTCLVKPPGPEREPTLDEFKIVKVIDKGSFGKVFLVVNKYTGQLHAMKRIDKDVLINKKQIQNTKNEKDILG